MAEARLLKILFWTSVGATILLILSMNQVDQDLWHLMALGREIVTTGKFPKQDFFAYTPTSPEFIHHEWGTGLIAYALAVSVGGTGIVLLKLALGLSTTLVTGLTLRLDQAPLHLLALVLPLSLKLLTPGFGTLRPQVCSYLFFAVLLYFLALDRRGERRWLFVWPFLFVIWLNVHGVFMIAFVCLGAEWIERIVKKEPARHLFVLGAVMGLLIAVNPYGLAFYPYMIYAVTIPRPHFTEWHPFWTMWGEFPFHVVVFGICVALSATSAVWKRKLPTQGALVLLVFAVAAMKTYRLGFFFALVFAAYAPKLLVGTRVDEVARTTWKKAAPALMPLCGVVTIALLYTYLQRSPLKLQVPTRQDTPGSSSVWYPEGVVRYLKANKVKGNMMVHFTLGAFVSWRLYPDVKVSMDSRNDAAYPVWLVQENIEFYRNSENWQTVASKYPTGMILAYEGAPLTRSIAASPQWRVAYRDEEFVLFAKAGAALPAGEHVAKVPEGNFP